MIEITNKYLTGYKYIDLFAGIGGFHLALSSLGAECVYANEWDSFAQKVYKDEFFSILFTVMLFGIPL